MLWEVSQGKATKGSGGYWGGVAFHGVTAVLALWFLVKALG
ncbi:MAG: hypothetical protein PVH68_20295 [Armatimonadota bacterium]